MENEEIRPEKQKIFRRIPFINKTNKAMEFSQKKLLFKQLIEQYVNDLKEKNVEIIFQSCPDEEEYSDYDWSKLHQIVYLQDNKNNLDWEKLFGEDEFDWKFDEAYFDLHEEIFSWYNGVDENPSISKYFDVPEVNDLNLQLNGFKLHEVLEFLVTRTKKLQDDLFQNDLCVTLQGTDVDNAYGDIALNTKVFLQTIDGKQIIRLDRLYNLVQNRDVLLGKYEEYWFNIDQDHPKYKLQDVFLNKLNAEQK
jgi:hypothetical protein